MRNIFFVTTLFLLLSQHAFADSMNAKHDLMSMHITDMGVDTYVSINETGDVLVKTQKSLYKFKITPEKTELLIAAFTKNNFDKMSKFYPCTYCDKYSEKTTISLTFNNKEVTSQDNNNPEFVAIVNQFSSILELPAAKAAAEAAKNNKTYDFFGDYALLMSGDMVYFKSYKQNDFSEGLFLIPADQAKRLEGNIYTGKCTGSYSGMMYVNGKEEFLPADVCPNNEILDFINQQVSTRIHGKAN